MSNAASSSLLLVVLASAAPAWSADPSSGPAGDATPDAAQDTAPAGDADVRDMSGTSIIGNRELPKSLYIVPWKNSEVGVRTDLSRDLLDEGLNPVDPNEFERQVQYHEYHQQQQ
jgi:hypothetical protein